jgi:hypothetical protein
MRPNHQNKRMRGRNRPGGGGSGGGKGPNPLTRSYESNGPDVKIRGTAQHIGEKYVQLGRDSQATGDHVAAESYFQHAEHYFRLIAAAQEVLRQQNPQYRPYEMNGDQDEEGEEEPPFGHGSPQPEVRYPAQQASGEQDGEQPRQQQYAPQQRDYQPREPREQREFQPREPRGDRRDYQPREQREPQNREPREQREFQPREPRGEQRDYQPRDNRGPREPRFPREPRPERAPALDAAKPDADLPAFITAPVRPLPPMIVGEDAPEAVNGAPVDGDDAGTFPLRARRRRGRPPRAEGSGVAAPDDVPVGE